MIVEIRLYGALRRYRPSDAPGAAHQSFALDLPLGSSVDDVSRWLGIPDGFVTAAAVNDQAVDTSVLLAESDRVSLFPPSAGGRLETQGR